MATDNADNLNLGSLRDQIDDLDGQIVELLNRRAGVVVQIGQIKHRQGTPVYAPDREKQVIDRIIQLSQGPLPPEALSAIYRELMSGSFALERKLRIGYLGPEGSFSHAGATAKFGHSVEYCALADIRSVFDEVARGRVDLGLVPIENTIGGGIIDTLDAFLDLQMRICAEVLVAIHHNLLGRCDIDRIERVYSKPEVFAQCRGWLSANNLADKTIGVTSTSRAAELVRDEPNSAAIGSSLAATLYDLPVLLANIEDNPNNVTRFFVIGRQIARPTGDDKTTLMFTTAHKVGALADVLDVFRKHQVNLTNIGSRPSRKQNWEYYFFVDCEGHCESPAVATAISEILQHCLQVSVLGSFPRATEVLGA